jgi:sodium-dependent dicarboxylate transporter 2/3/5
MVERHRLTLHTLGGPAVFLLLAFSPVPAVPYPIRASIGLLLWMSWWWITRPVHLAVTGFLPLVVLAVFDFLPVATILPAYADSWCFCSGRTFWTLWRAGDWTVASPWCRSWASTGTRQQILAWFVVATV